MALITENFITGFILFTGYTGQSSSSQGSQDATSSFSGGNLLSSIKLTELDTTVNVSSGYNIYYKMQGYNPLTQKYEDWHSMGAPLLSPPSGHMLQNISIISSWEDR